MLDLRLYRAAFVPVLLAFIVAAFSLRDQPGAATSSLAPDAFDGAAATADLQGLASRYPQRRAGSRGDAALAATVRDRLAARGFRVHTQRFDGRTADGSRGLVDVVAERTGFSSRRIVVVAHRDALGRGAAAELSGTAVLLELGRVLGQRTLKRSVELVSTSGGAAGAAGAEDLAQRLQDAGGVDAVIVLGDLGGVERHTPSVLPWSDAKVIAPARLRRTAELAVHQEAGDRADEPGWLSMFARLAFPLTPTEQGPFGAHGLPAVLISGRGELAPPAAERISERRLNGMGRGVLRAITALDGGPAAGPAEPYLVVARKAVPEWAIRLLVAAFILPALVAAVDGFARVRRRRQPVLRWLGWVVANAVPFVLAAAFALIARATGLLEAAPAIPVPPGAVPLDGSAIALLSSAALIALLAWVGLRPLLLRALDVRGETPGPGGAIALLLVLVAALGVTWIVNPFLAALCVPLLHAVVLASAPEIRLRAPLKAALLVLSVAPFGVLILYYALQLQLGLGDVLWMALLLVAGGQVTPLGALLGAVLAGCWLGAAVALVRAAREPRQEEKVTVRGPMGYAGPGSLGGTKSALRR